MRATLLALAVAMMAPAAVLEAQARQNPTYLKQLVGAKDRAEERDLPNEDGGIGETIDRIGRSFETGDADELEECLVRKQLYLSLKARGEEAGYYGRSQVRFIFDKLFRERRTESFTYDSADTEISSDGTARFRAEWTYIVLDKDELVPEQLSFKMEKSGREWHVSEIRAQPRQLR